MEEARTAPPRRCRWCGGELQTGGRGRPKEFCSASCRQAAYEQRRGLAGRRVKEGDVVLRAERADRLRDSLFALRCAAEDVATAAREGADGSEIAALSEELVAMAKDIERLR